MGIVSEPWGGGKGLPRTKCRGPCGNRGPSEGQGRLCGAPKGRRRPRGTHASVPPRAAGCGQPGWAAHEQWPHEVSRTGAGRWPDCVRTRTGRPGRKTATRPAVSSVERRRCPARHAGNRVISTPVTRTRRAATGSGPAGASGGVAVRRVRHRSTRLTAGRASLAVHPRLARNPPLCASHLPLGENI